jgi:hypothetical protein
MYSESVCQFARSWVDVGSFNGRLFGVVYFVLSSVREFPDKPLYIYIYIYTYMASFLIKVKGKGHPITGTKGLKEERYSSTHSQPRH